MGTFEEDCGTFFAVAGTSSVSGSISTVPGDLLQFLAMFPQLRISCTRYAFLVPFLLLLPIRTSTIENCNVSPAVDGIFSAGWGRAVSAVTFLRVGVYSYL